MPQVDQQLFTMIAAIAAMIAAGCSLVQGVMQYKQSKHDFYTLQNEHSASLALFYANQIIPRSTYILYVLKRSKSYSSLKSSIASWTSDERALSHFDSKEFKSIVGSTPEVFSKELFKEMLEGNEEIWGDMMYAHEYLRLTYPNIGKHVDAIPPDNPSDADAMSAYRKSTAPMLVDEFNTVSNEVLNKIEYFSMMINTGVADETTLYPSMHQTFFDVMTELYWYVCKANSASSGDRFFTHATDLYKLWIGRRNDCAMEERTVGEKQNRAYKRKRERMQ